MKRLSLVFLVSGLLGCHGADKSDDEEKAPKPVVEVTLATVKVGSITARMSVTGTLSPLPNQEAKISPLTPGRIKAIFVKVGDKVRKGQLIATLDPVAAAGQAQQAQAAVRVAQATLVQARVNFSGQHRTQRANVDQARLTVEAQRIALAKLRAGSRPQEISQAQSAVASAQAALTNAQQNLSRSQTLFSQGLLARKDLEAAQTQESTARSALTSAQQALSLAKQGNRPEDIRAGEVAVKQAEQQLQAAQAQEIQIASKAQDVRIAQGQLEAANGALQSARSQIHALEIISPVAGTVVARAANAGESVDVTSAIATVVNLDHLRLLLNVPASQINSVTVGDLVNFATDADPEVTRQAHVSVVTRAVDSATNSVQVEALVANPGNSLRDDGMVKAQIFSAAHHSVLLVPVGAVVVKDDKATVYIAGQDNVVHAKEVKTGIQNGELVEITSGLSSGDRIVMSGVYELDDGTQIKVSR